MTGFGKSSYSGILAVIILIGIGIVAYFYVNRDDTPGDYHVKSGNHRLEDGNFNEAIDEFKEAIKVNPKHPNAYLGLGIAYLKLNKLDMALKNIDKAIDIDSEFAGAYANRGIVNDYMGEYKLAVADYKKAIKLNPEISEGPGWLWKFLRGIDKDPPTIADRAKYIEAELKKPIEKQLLRLPKIDKEQRMYSHD